MIIGVKPMIEATAPRRCEISAPDHVELADVELVRRTDLVLVYRIDGREVRIPPLQVLSGSVTTPNRRGKLVIPRWLAKDLGLDGKRS